MVVIGVICGFACAAAPVQPTGFAFTDVVVCFGFAVVVTLAAARARRSTWIWMAAGAALLTHSGVWFVAALLALALALAAAFLPRRRLIGAVVAALALPALMRAEPFGFTGASALCVWVALVPVLVSGYRVASGRSRERMHKVATVVAIVVMIGVIVFALVVWLSSHDLNVGSTSAKSGLTDLRGGKGPEAALLLGEASDSLGSAHTVLSGWWTFPVHLVPFLSQQLEGLSVASGQGHDIAAAGSVVAAKADYHELRYVEGSIDLVRLAQLEKPLQTINGVLGTAKDKINDVRSPWLVGPVRTALDTFSADIAQTSPQAQIAQQAVAVAPAMLGAGGKTRHYFIAFTTESESRGLNGFMGNWAELTASNGKLSISHQGRVDDLSRLPGQGQRVITGPAEYLDRYQRFHVGKYFQDVTLSPDLPDVADVIRELYSGKYPNMGQDRIDGVLVVDPYGLASLLNFTGPINVAGAPQLTAGNAAQELLINQYSDLQDKSDRVDFLTAASKRTFAALTKGTIPGPDQIASVLGPEVRARHIMFTSFEKPEQALFARLGATGAFPGPNPAMTSSPSPGRTTPTTRPTSGCTAPSTTT